MKILFLTRRFYPDIGGVEKHVAEISTRLASKGNEITIITELPGEKNDSTKFFYQTHGRNAKGSLKSERPVKSSFFEYTYAKKIRILYFNFGKDNWFKKFKIWSTLLRNKSIIKEADIVHCHDVFFWFLPFRFIMPTKKIYTTFHGYESFPIKKKNILVRRISEILSNGNICVGGFMKKWYHANPSFVIYGGVNIPKKTRLVKEPKALFFGRLDDQTGITTYVKAAKLLKKKIPNFRLDIIGDGPLKRKINHKSFKFDEEIEAKIKNYRYIFVSRYLSILEAIASQKMVFAVYDNPVKKDYLEHSPFKKHIIIVNNADELASKVQYYYSNNKIEQEKIMKSFKWVKKQNWDKIVLVYLQLWRK